MGEKKIICDFFRLFIIQFQLFTIRNIQNKVVIFSFFKMFILNEKFTHNKTNSLIILIKNI